MPITTAARIQPLALATPSLREATARAEDRQQAKALRRWQIARIAATAESLVEARRLIAVLGQMELSAATPFGVVALPSMKTLARHKERWEAGARAVEDYRDLPRQGRPTLVLAPTLASTVDAFVFESSLPSVRQLAQQVRELAAENGTIAPSAKTLARRLSGLRLERTAARFGRRTAELEAMPHGTVPVDHTHDVWLLDELTMPVYASMYCTVEQQWVPIRPDVVLIEDAASRVILSAHVCNPARRNDANGRRQRSGYDRADVVGALLSASNPELAEPRCCAPFAQHFPETLRWDNASAHVSARDGGVVDGGEDMAPLTNVLGVPRLPSGRPINRGEVERLVGTLKGLCHAFPSHVDRVRPFEKTTEVPEASRVQAAAMGDRVSRQQIVPADSLPTIPELEALLAAAVDRYNRTPHEGLDGLTPAMAYQEKRARHPRSGRDLLAVLPSRTVTVGAEGITLYRKPTRHRFAARTPSFSYRIDQMLTVCVDPLYRGLFTRQGREWVFLRTATAEARATDPGKFAKEQRAAARMASQLGADASKRATISALATQFAAKILDEAAAQIAAGTPDPEATAPAVAPTGATATAAETPEAQMATEIAPNVRRTPRPRRGFAPRRNLDDARPGDA